jgi:uncharacterized protein with HEPN domain
MLACIRNIQEFTEGMTFEAFTNDLRTIRAVAFELTTLGEAARVIPVETQKRYPHIPWDKMQAIRNVIIHEYFLLVVEILWKTIQDDLPPLRVQLEGILIG